MDTSIASIAYPHAIQHNQGDFLLAPIEKLLWKNKNMV